MQTESTAASSSVRTSGAILVRGVNWLGDAVMTTPALQRLRERYPEACITLLTHEKLADLWKGHSSIDSIIPFAAGESVWSVARRLRERHFELSLILPNSPRSAMESWLAGIPRRVGYARPWRKWFLTQAIPTREGHVRMHKRSAAEVRKLVQGTRPADTQDHISPNAHQIHEYLALTGALGANTNPLAPRLDISDAEMQEAAQKFGLPDQQTQSRRPLFGLNAAAEFGPAKRWPKERFISAATEIQRRTNCGWVIFGGKSDVGLAQEIAEPLRAAGSKCSAELIDLSGRTTLRELCAALKLCRVLLTNDTGPMHLAAAVGTPVVVPFGSTSPELTGPGEPTQGGHELLRAGVPCSPCFRRTCPIDFRCMTGITVDRVVEAVLRAASGTPA